MAFWSYSGTGVRSVSSCDAEIVGSSSSFACGDSSTSVYVLFRNTYGCKPMPASPITLWRLRDTGVWDSILSIPVASGYSGYVYVAFSLTGECGHELMCRYEDASIKFSIQGVEPDPDPVLYSVFFKFTDVVRGVPVAGVQVVAGKDGSSYSAFSDSAGVAHLTGLPDYRGFSLVASADGFDTKSYPSVNLPISSSYSRPYNIFLTSSEPVDPVSYNYELVVRFSEWAHGGFGLLRVAGSTVSAALAGLLGINWGNPVFSDPSDPDLELEIIEMRVPFAVGIGSVSAVMTKLKPLFLLAMKFALALGVIVTSWKVVDLVSQKQDDAAETQKVALVEYLTNEGYSADEIAAILAAIYGLDDNGDWVSKIVPVALVLGAAYVLSDIVKR